MNCFIILLLLCCSGHSNGVCRDNDHNHSCGCTGNNNENSCGRKDRCDNNCEKVSCDRCDEDRRNSGRFDSDCGDLQGTRATSWQDYANYNRNDSYSRNETCGCEEN